VLVHLLAALRLDLGGTEVDGPLEERRAQLGGDDVGQGPREHDRGEADDEDGDPVVLIPGEPSAAALNPGPDPDPDPDLLTLTLALHRGTWRAIGSGGSS